MKFKFELYAETPDPPTRRRVAQAAHALPPPHGCHGTVTSSSGCHGPVACFCRMLLSVWSAIRRPFAHVVGCGPALDLQTLVAASVGWDD